MDLWDAAGLLRFHISIPKSSNLKHFQPLETTEEDGEALENATVSRVIAKEISTDVLSELDGH